MVDPFMDLWGLFMGAANMYIRFKTIRRLEEGLQACFRALGTAVMRCLAVLALSAEHCKQQVRQMKACEHVLQCCDKDLRSARSPCL